MNRRKRRSTASNTNTPTRHPTNSGTAVALARRRLSASHSPAPPIEYDEELCTPTQQTSAIVPLPDQYVTMNSMETTTQPLSEQPPPPPPVTPCSVSSPTTSSHQRRSSTATVNARRALTAAGSNLKTSLFRRGARLIPTRSGSGSRATQYGTMGGEEDGTLVSSRDVDVSAVGDETGDGLVGGSDSGSPLSSPRRTFSNYSSQQMVGGPDHASLVSVSGGSLTGRSTSLANGSRSDEEAVVTAMESSLRRVLLLLAVYLLGAWKPEGAGVAWKICELAGVAWGTCLVILGLAWFRRWWWGGSGVGGRRHVAVEAAGLESSAVGGMGAPLESTGAMVSSVREMSPIKRERSLSTQDETIPLLEEQESQLEEGAKEYVSEVAHPRAAGPRSTELPPDAPVPPIEEIDTSQFSQSLLQRLDKTQTHPALENLFIIDTNRMERVTPNAGTVPYVNELFDGVMKVMIRTPDADSKDGCPAGTAQNDAVSDYFRDKQRRFEYQWQLKLKKLPTGAVFIGCELEEPIKMGLVQRAFANGVLNFIKKMNNGFHFSVSGGDASGKMTESAVAEGRYQKPHISFTVEASMDRIVVTKPGQAPPVLGEVIVEEPESIKHRKKGGKVEWNLDDTYTFALYSGYADFLEWKCMNFPGIRPFSMSTVTGYNYVNLNLYQLQGRRDAGGKPNKGSQTGEKAFHFRCNIEVVSDLEISIVNKTAIGPCAKKWIAANVADQERVARGANREGLLAVEEKDEERSTLLLNGGHGEDETLGTEMNGEGDLADEFLENEQDLENEECETLEELGEGMYLKSGDKVILREAIEGGDQSRNGFVTTGGGFAVLQSQAASTIIIEKARRFHEGGKSEENGRSKLIKSGDTVILKLVARDSGEDAGEVKYLSLHRGWWLKWVANMPRHNGYFTIFTRETEVEIETGNIPKSPTAETQTSHLTLGGSFLLRHERYSRYEVGVSLEDSATFGGRMLGIYKTGAPAAGDEFPEDDEEQKGDIDFEGTEAVGKGKKKWMRPLRLCADVSSSTSAAAPSLALLYPALANPSGEISVESDTTNTIPLAYVGHVNLDVPSWVEMMHRTKRTRQRVYVVRTCREEASTFVDDATESDEQKAAESDEISLNTEAGPTKPSEQVPSLKNPATFMRLRTGQDLAAILRLGLSWRSGNTFVGGEKGRRAEDEKSEDMYGNDQESSAIDLSTDEDGNAVDPAEGPHVVQRILNEETQNAIDDSEEIMAEQESDEGRGERTNDEGGDEIFTGTYTDTSTHSRGGSDMDDKTESANIRDELAGHGRKKSSSEERKNGKSRKKVRILSRKGSRKMHESAVDSAAAAMSPLLTPKERGSTRKRSSGGTEHSQETTVFPRPRANEPNDPVSNTEVSQSFSPSDSPCPREADDESESESDFNGDEMDRLVFEEDAYEDIAEDDFLDPPMPPRLDGVSPRKGNTWIKTPRNSIVSSVAKSVKTGTTMTSKHVVKQGRKVGKGTAIAGRAIISKGIVHGRKPPGREPRNRIKARTAERSNEKRRGRDHHEALNKAMKSINKRASRGDMDGSGFSHPARVLAGQLSAPDQSCRTVSHVLSEMSSIPVSSSLSSRFNTMLMSQVSSRNDLDSWFLRGGSAEIGVVPTKYDNEQLLHECLVARCLWDSHWREEWCGLYNKHLSFYVPLSKKPEFELSLLDVQSVRRLDPPFDVNPLPGHPFLVIETPWRCHYLAFSEENDREAFMDQLNNAVFSYSVEDDKGKSTRAGTGKEKEGWKMHFWEGFQNSVESSLSGGRGKWAPVSSSSKTKQRTILNGRRMAFDIEPFSTSELSSGVGSSTSEEVASIAKFVENMLTTALSFSVDSLESYPKQFVNFLDASSRLRSLPLHKLDLSSNESFCIFVNIYHCLLQHALLLTVHGPPNKRSVGHFMRCTCYEIGGDVFSLAELQCCVIRGNSSRALSPKPPYVEPPKTSEGHRFYALSNVDPRINFVLNNGDLSNPSAVPVLTPYRLDSQLSVSSSVFLDHQFVLDGSKRTIYLPKVCDVYRNDFGDGDAMYCVMFCVQFVNETKQALAVELFNDEGNNPVIKFQPSCEQFHSHLTLMT